MTRKQSESRGMSTPLSHVLSVGITTILLVGLVSGAAGFLDGQSERTAREEMDTIANRLASELHKADQLGTQGANVTLNTTHPDAIAGSTYTVEFASQTSDCTSPDSETCLEVSATGFDYEATVNVSNSTDLDLEERGGGEFVISSRNGTAGDQVPTRSLDLSARVGIGGDVGAGPPIGVGTALERQPISRFTFRPGQPEVDSDVTFDARESFDPDGNITDYAWDWESDGTYDRNGSDEEVTHDFDEGGNHNVTLKVTDEDNNTAEYTRHLRLSGLVYGEMRNASETRDGLEFTVTNEYQKEIEIERVLVDPQDDSLTEIETNGGDDEIEVDATESGCADGEIHVEEDGAIVRVGVEDDGTWDDCDLDDPIDLAAGETATITIQEFDWDIVGEQFTVGVRYLRGSNYNGNTFTDDVEESVP